MGCEDPIGISPFCPCSFHSFIHKTLYYFSCYESKENLMHPNPGKNFSNFFFVLKEIARKTTEVSHTNVSKLKELLDLLFIIQKLAFLSTKKRGQVLFSNNAFQWCLTSGKVISLDISVDCWDPEVWTFQCLQWRSFHWAFLFIMTV